MKRFLKKFLFLVLDLIILISLSFNMMSVSIASYVTEGLDENVFTNNSNIEFSAMLQNNNGEKANEVKAKMDAENLQLSLSITVKKDGYFTGRININSSNFKLKTDILSEGISKIEQNTIVLSQIKAGETKSIDIGIEIIKDDKFDINSINAESSVFLEGTYVNSSEKNIEIKSEKKVRLILENP